MQVQGEAHTDALFHALADQTRRDILRRVLTREHSVSELAGRYDMSFAAVRKHVLVLERAGFVTRQKRGREALTRGRPETVRSAALLLQELEAQWRGRIARIDALLSQEDAPSPAKQTQTRTDHSKE